MRRGAGGDPGRSFREVAQEVHRERQRAGGVELARGDVAGIDRMLADAIAGQERGRLETRAVVARRRLIIALGGTRSRRSRRQRRSSRRRRDMDDRRKVFMAAPVSNTTSHPSVAASPLSAVASWVRRLRRRRVRW
jgi:hypothetical protein